MIVLAGCKPPPPLFLPPSLHPTTRTHSRAHTLFLSRLGAWQFLADMPYGSISLKTAWMIFWNIYCKDQGSGTTTTAPGAAATVTEEGGGGGEVGGQRARARTISPSTTEEIQDAIRGTMYIFHVHVHVHVGVYNNSPLGIIICKI